MSSSGEQTPLLNDSNSTSDPPPPFASDSNLTKFRKAIGINVAVHIDGGDLEAARKGARGLYKEVIGLQRWRSRQYKLVESVYYVALGTQILIGATLASLGPLSKLHNMAITVLGVVNAAGAGVLALLKGQGLPDRLRKDEFEMKKVQDFIEETEIRLAVGGEEEFTQQELEDVVGQVWDKYNVARDTAMMNKPSSYSHQVESVDGKGNSTNRGVGRHAVPADSKAKGKFVID
ncbi:hypothetical protein LAWI1_G000422 [Lachnellula willkommii]|uniref:SMODS and SLOG-associating 2TM effector domain-containing protein n=1 Tax=Lachnellula willkommii TaxID=215461 RepID=A0A559MJP2_9HELO|nr:hypothetical protein LAWI1_G000422 [Lachnellula willkommii]